jgi:hypothetical protein
MIFIVTKKQIKVFFVAHGTKAIEELVLKLQIKNK